MINRITLLLFIGLGFATTINIPSDYSTIQSGIDAASDGDTVLVQPGTYYENGQKSMEGNSKHPMNRMVGKWNGWYESGKKMYESDSDDSGNGTYTEWYENGQKKEEGKINSMGMKDKQIVNREDGSTITDSNDIFQNDMNNTLKNMENDYNKNSKDLGLDTTFDDFLDIIRGK